MKREQWYAIVAMSRIPLVKGNSLGREVFDFEIHLAIEACRMYSTELPKVTHIMYTDIKEGDTYRSITESIHKTITREPEMFEDCWVNVWHSVAETAYLGLTKPEIAFRQLLIFSDVVIQGMLCYSAYCQECRDWEPRPKMFHELSTDQKRKWALIETIIGLKMETEFNDNGIVI